MGSTHDKNLRTYWKTRQRCIGNTNIWRVWMPTVVKSDRENETALYSAVRKIALPPPVKQLTPPTGCHLPPAGELIPLT